MHCNTVLYFQSVSTLGAGVKKPEQGCIFPKEYPGVFCLAPALSSGFYARPVILKAEKALGTRLRLLMKGRCGSSQKIQPNSIDTIEQEEHNNRTSRQ